MADCFPNPPFGDGHRLVPPSMSMPHAGADPHLRFPGPQQRGIHHGQIMDSFNRLKLDTNGPRPIQEGMFPQGPRQRSPTVEFYEGIILRKIPNPPNGQLPSWSFPYPSRMEKSQEKLIDIVQKRGGKKAALKEKDKLRSQESKLYIEKLIMGKNVNEPDDSFEWTLVSVEDCRKKTVERKALVEETVAIKIILKREYKRGVTGIRSNYSRRENVERTGLPLNTPQRSAWESQECIQIPAGYPQTQFPGRSYPPNGQVLTPDNDSRSFFGGPAAPQNNMRLTGGHPPGPLNPNAQFSVNQGGPQPHQQPNRQGPPHNIPPPPAPYVQQQPVNRPQPPANGPRNTRQGTPQPVPEIIEIVDNDDFSEAGIKVVEIPQQQKAPKTGFKTQNRDNRQKKQHRAYENAGLGSDAMDGPDEDYSSGYSTTSPGPPTPRSPPNMNLGKKRQYFDNKAFPKGKKLGPENYGVRSDLSRNTPSSDPFDVISERGRVQNRQYYKLEREVEALKVENLMKEMDIETMKMQNQRQQEENLRSNNRRTRRDEFEHSPQRFIDRTAERPRRVRDGPRSGRGQNHDEYDDVNYGEERNLPRHRPHRNDYDDYEGRRRY